MNVSLSRTLNKEKILYFTWFFQPYLGSASFIHYEIARKLSDKFDVEIFSCYSRCVMSNGKMIDYKSLPILHPSLMLIRYNLSCFKKYVEILKARHRYIRSLAFIISQHHSWHPASIWAIKIGTTLRKPVIVRVDDIFLNYEEFNLLTQKYYFMMFNKYTKILNLSSLIAVVSSEHKKIMLEKLKVGSDDSIIIHPNFIDSSKFEQSKPKVDFRETFSLSDYVITYAGSYTSYAGISALLKAFRYIVREYRKTTMILCIINLNKKILANIKKLVNKYGLDKNIIIISLPRKLVIDLLIQSDILLGPISRHIANYGSIPLKVLEYMVLGKPVIVSKLISNDLAINLYNSIKIKTEDEHELANAIEMLLNDENLRKRLGSNAKKHIKEHFDSKKVNASFVDKILKKCYS